MIGRAFTGLPHARIEAKIGGKPLWIAEAPNVADCRGNARSHGDVEAGQRHQAADCRILEGMYGDIRLDHRQRLVDLVNQAEVALDGGALIGRQYLPRQPFAPADPDEVPMRTRRDQVGVEDRLD